MPSAGETQNSKEFENASSDIKKPRILTMSKEKGKRGRKPKRTVGNNRTNARQSNNDDGFAVISQQRRQRKRKKKKRLMKDSGEVDEASRIQKRARNLMIKMKFELNLIDAYSGEGWKGQSREKIRPEHELQRAMNQILKCKLGIREAIRQLDSLSSEGCIDDSAIAPDGSVYHENIFCAKCRLREAFPDNDIILCDGTCNCAFHQKCLDPPLLTEDIPQGDQGWFCKFCDCKMDILDALNAHTGTNFPGNSNWQDIFMEEAVLNDGRKNDDAVVQNAEEEWPSDESDDDDYDPEKLENTSSQSKAQSEDNSSELSSSLCLLEGDLLVESDSSDGESEIISGRRQRRAVDYTKLYHEMFGKDATVNEAVSDDEDWGPTSKRKRREKESDAASTLIALCEIEDQCPNEENNNNNNNDSNNNNSFDEDTRNPSKKIKRSLFRIPPHAVEKLRRVFKENELPSKELRDELAGQLGIDSEKIYTWFKNARSLALKSRKQQERTNSPVNVSPRISKSEEIEKEIPTDKFLSNDTMTSAAISADKVQVPDILTNQLDDDNNIKLLTDPIKKSPTKTKVAEDFGDELSSELTKEKSKKKETRVDFYTAKILEQQSEAEAEMERICKLEVKVQKLNHVLLTFPNCTQNSPASVIFVPFAELHEKKLI
jgi:hypothetical protein